MIVALIKKKLIETHFLILSIISVGINGIPGGWDCVNILYHTPHSG